MFRILSLFLVGVLLTSCSLPSKFSSEPEVDGVTLIEEVKANSGELQIPYSKYRLENGLTVIIHEDTSDPLVHVDVTYHVGSAREEARRSGFAHFFEHMMFQGSAHVGDDEHFKIVTEVGGTMNGTTNNDRTNYFETVPSNNLETMLWLEADRMGFLLEAVTQEKFEIQRATVKNERGQNYDNRPYGLWGEKNSAALYPPDHPYAWPVIGYLDDLDAASLDDLKKFFLRWYGPNNATITIGGAVDKTAALNLVKKYFATIPAGPEVVSDVRAPVALDKDRYISYVDKNIRFPALLFTFPTVPMNHPDRIALECLSDVIGQGRKSYMYKQFVQTSKAIDASSFGDNMELAGSLTLFVLPYPGVSLSDFEGEMRELLNNFNADSITDEDIQIFKSTREAGMVRGLTSVRGKVSRLAYYQTFYDDPNRIPAELAAVRSLTKEDVLAVFNKYIKNQPAVIQSVVPESDPNSQAKPDNFVFPDRPARADSDVAGLAPRPVADDFDRSTKPTPGAAPLVKVPDYWETTIAEDIPAIGIQSEELPLVTIELQFYGGHLLESPDKAGVASLMAAMMNEGTQDYSAEEFEIELLKLGSQISVSSGTESINIGVTSLTDRLDETLALLEERLFASKFAEDDLDRLRQQQIEGIEANLKQASSIATDAYRKLLYGPGHPLAISADGEKDTLEKITLQDIRNYSQKSFVAGDLEVVVVGDVSKGKIIEKLSFLEKLPKGNNVIAKLPEPPVHIGGTIYLIDKPGAAQSEIRIGYLTDLTYDATGEYFKRYLMNYVLGDAFSSRINLNLREDKGYTYGARSRFSGSKLPGPFTASAGVKKEATADSITQFVNEIKGYADVGISETELSFMRSAIGQSDALSYETPGQKAGFLGQIIEYDLPRDFVEQQLSIINGISKADIDALAKKHLPFDKMLMLVVGDKAVIGESIAELGYPIVELDARANPVVKTKKIASEVPH